MKKRFNWNRIAQWAVVLLSALALKQYYSSASANQLRWILAPTTLLVEIVSGASFEFESYAGYISSDRSFLIAPSCAGVNFLITAFLMLSAKKLLRDRSQAVAWGFIPAAALIAYLVTLAANTVRIALALRLDSLPEISFLNSNQLHRVEGIFVYFGFLMLLLAVSEKTGAGKTSGLLRQAFFPLLLYYTTMLAIPLANGGYRQGSGFLEHSVFVLLIPLLLILPFAIFGWLWKRVDKVNGSAIPSISVPSHGLPQRLPRQIRGQETARATSNGPAPVHPRRRVTKWQARLARAIHQTGAKASKAPPLSP